ncbi:GGDEF domain-containing protein [Deinococcus rubellus]|uniref:Sensor domain-containing diguanylate cyclase n=1 Tax=Deinococcus rubellus TaxID=1889240 RepID=A0ABY5YH31_9DEIO|nr:sensor domain-containing diguanylate cyclase [Deinococcus rubellus]UWX64120.1 sensor domain-containing diguanylate cyclase [Deinococcus rubellus]
MNADLPTPTRGNLTLRRTYWLTLLVLGVLSIASNVLLSMQVEATSATAALVNTAGRQRMLAVRIAADAEHAAATHDPHSLSDLRASLATLEANHARLSDAASGLYTSGFAPDVRRFYAAQVNPRVAAFTAAGRRILETPPEQLSPQQPDVAFLTLQARGPLLVALDRAVALDEHRSDQVIARVQRLSWLRVGAVVTLLLTLGLGVFRPLERRNRELLSRLAAEHAAASQQASYAQALLRISELSDTDLPPEQVAHELTATVARTLGLDWAALGLLSGNGSQLAGVYAHPALPAALMAQLNHTPRPGEGMIWDVARGGQPVYVDDYAHLGNARPALVDAGLSGAAWVPLGTFEGVQYLLCGARLGPRPWQAADRNLLEAAARTVTVALHRRLYLHELQAAALSDALTGLGNRRAFERDLKVGQAQASRQGQTLAVMMLDLDGLKQVNDIQGHERGDALLRGFGHLLAQAFRHSDQVYRLGGDEFAVLLPAAAPEHARELLERAARVAEPLHAQGFPGAGASAGLAISPLDGGDAATLVRLADERMYASKRERKAAQCAQPVTAGERRGSPN